MAQTVKKPSKSSIKSVSVATTSEGPVTITSKIIVAFLILSAIIVGIILASHHHNSANQVTSCGTVNSVRSSNNSPFSGCFDQNFKTCRLASTTINNDTSINGQLIPLSKVNYKIIGKQGDNCLVQWKYTEYGFLPQAVNQPMTCPYDSSKEFNQALKLNASYIGCHGPLLSILTAANKP